MLICAAWGPHALHPSFMIPEAPAAFRSCWCPSCCCFSLQQPIAGRSSQPGAPSRATAGLCCCSCLPGQHSAQPLAHLGCLGPPHCIRRHSLHSAQPSSCCSSTACSLLRNSHCVQRAAAPKAHPPSPPSPCGRASACSADSWLVQVGHGASAAGHDCLCLVRAWPGPGLTLPPAALHRLGSTTQHRRLSSSAQCTARLPQGA